MRFAGILTFFCLSIFGHLARAATPLETMLMAQHLGDVLGSEAFCGLSYDQEAIATFISKHVPADDMGFNSNLELFTQGATSQFNDMSSSVKTAHCVQTARVARSYGFIH